MPKLFLNSARISPDHLAIAMAQVKLGFWELDLITKQIECTSQNRMNFGFDQDQVLSEQSIMNAIIPEDRWRRINGVSKAMNPDTPTYDFEIRVRHPDSSIHWLHIRGTVIFEDQLPRKVIGTSVDISAKKGMEILRDELLNIATHELKSPLSVVRGYLQLLSKFISSIGNTKYQLIADRAVTANGRVERLIDDMMNANVHSESEMVLKREDFDLDELILEVIANSQLTHHTTLIEYEPSSKAMQISGDRYRLSQVLTNLVNNAIKYSPGEPSINLSLTSDFESITVCVNDTGVGIADHEREKIFEKFYRVEGSSHMASGSGIGLYLCAEIILRHEGKITVLPNPAGKGSQVCFILPRN